MPTIILSWRRSRCSPVPAVARTSRSIVLAVPVGANRVRGWPDDGDRCTPARRRPRDEARYRYEVYWCDGGLRVYEQHEVRDAVHEVSRVARAGSAEAEGER